MMRIVDLYGLFIQNCFVMCSSKKILAMITTILTAFLQRYLMNILDYGGEDSQRVNCTTDTSLFISSPHLHHAKDHIPLLFLSSFAVMVISFHYFLYLSFSCLLKLLYVVFLFASTLYTSPYYCSSVSFLSLPVSAFCFFLSS